MKRGMFLLGLIRKLLRDERFDPFEADLVGLARDQFRQLGISARANCIQLPFSLNADEREYFKRGLDTQAFLIQGENQFLLNPISEKSVFIEAGATFFPTQVRDIKIPSFSGILASWAEEGEDPDSDGDPITINGVLFQGKRLMALLDVPAILIQQGGEEAEKWLKDNIIAALAATVDETLGGILVSVTGTRPQGMGYKITTGMDTKQNAIVPTYKDIVAMEEAITLNVPVGNYRFITNQAGRRILRTTPTITGGPDMIFKDGKILDHQAHISDLVSGAAGADGLGNLLIYGNFADIGLAMFGGYDIVVDPYTLKKAGKIQLSINAYFDFKGLRGSLATDALDVTQADDYAYSFTTLAIKAS